MFVAIYPPEETRRAMLEALVARRSAAPHRVVPTEQVHMTVQFVGEAREKEVEEVAESVRRSAAGIGAFSLTPVRLISLPASGVPRLIAMETDAPAGLLELHRRLAMRLARSPRAKTGDRFLPHLTLCRFSGVGRPERVEARVEIPVFECRGVSVMRSVLRAEGAEHSVVEEVELG